MMWSPINSVRSIEPEGILYAWIRNVRRTIASANATMNASPYSRAADLRDSAESADGSHDKRRGDSVTGGDLLPKPQQGEERFLRDFHPSNLLHSFLAFFLLFEQLAFARDVSAVALGGDILAQRLDALPCDNPGP